MMSSPAFKAEKEPAVILKKSCPTLPGAQLRTLAASEDQDKISIAASVEVLRDNEWVALCLPVSHGGISLGAGGAGARDAVSALGSLAEYNLCLARIFEGHVNALGLIFRWGSPQMQSRIAEQVKEGQVMGVWGADASVPVSFDVKTRRLTGAKRYASGLGVVSQAVVTARTAAGVQLCLVDVNDPSRADLSQWNMSGMRASASGHFDLNDMVGKSVEPLGKTDVYQIEPWFHGGVWRIAAVQIGGVFGALELAREELQRLDRMDNEAHVARLTPILFRAQAARELIVAVASSIDEIKAPVDADALMARSMSTRLLTEEIGLDAIVAVERSIGLSMFESTSHVGRQCRDLATYLRQAAPDGFLQMAGRAALLGNQPLAGDIPS